VTSAALDTLNETFYISLSLYPISRRHSVCGGYHEGGAELCLPILVKVMFLNVHVP